jgi:IS30 family transposase
VRQRKSDLSEVYVYKADYAQMKVEKASKNKETKIKIDDDPRLLHFIERKIRDEKYSPDAALAAAKRKGNFQTMICTKAFTHTLIAGFFRDFQQGFVGEKEQVEAQIQESPPNRLE